MRKNYTAMLLAGGLAAAALFGGCSKKETNEGTAGGFTMPSLPPVSDSVLSPVPNSFDNFVGIIGSTGEPACEVQFIRGDYYDDNRNPSYFVVTTPERLKKEVFSDFTSGDAAGTDPASEYDDAYFKNYTVLVVILPYSSGSTKTEMPSVRIVDGTVNIALTSSTGEVITDDMATFYGIIGLDKAFFGENPNVRITLNNSEVKQHTNSRVETE